MKYIWLALGVVGVSILSYLAGIAGLWFMAYVVAMLLVPFTTSHRGWACLIGFLGVGLSWLFQLLVVNGRNDFLLLPKVADIFALGTPGLIVVVIIIGGLLGLLGAWLGVEIRRLFWYRGRQEGTRIM